jgi:hypothetical protein
MEGIRLMDHKTYNGIGSPAKEDICHFIDIINIHLRDKGKTAFQGNLDHLCTDICLRRLRLPRPQKSRENIKRLNLAKIASPLKGAGLLQNAKSFGQEAVKKI